MCVYLPVPLRIRYVPVCVIEFRQVETLTCWLVRPGLCATEIVPPGKMNLPTGALPRSARPAAVKRPLAMALAVAVGDVDMICTCSVPVRAAPLELALALPELAA